MGIANLSYEECRRKRLEENKKRMEALNLPLLSQALLDSSPSKSSPVIPFPFFCFLLFYYVHCFCQWIIVLSFSSITNSQSKLSKPRVAQKQLVVVRRSSRVAKQLAPVYAEVVVNRVVIPRRTSKCRDLSNRVYASDEARQNAFERAEKLQSGLEPSYPNFIKSMLPSHVSGGFWMGLPSHFCKTHLPNRDGVMTLIDEDGDEYPTVYLARKTGLSGGWLGFAVAHKLADGDAVIFQFIKPLTCKVYILRANSSREDSDSNSS